MKVLAVLAFTAQAAPGPSDGCYWQSSKSGGYIECLPDYYIRSACESGSRDDCHVDSLIGHGTSFGIECCPSDRTLNFENPTNCQWLGGKSGDAVPCPEGQAAFGRCSTSDKGNHDHCNNLSHQVKCCDSDTAVQEAKCGWVYATYGVQKECPPGTVAAGFCGVNNTGDCPNDSFVGIRCCPP